MSRRPALPGDARAATVAALAGAAQLILAAYAALQVLLWAGGGDAAASGTTIAAVLVLAGVAVTLVRPRTYPWPAFVPVVLALVWGVAVAASGPTGLGSTWFTWQELFVVVVALSWPARAATAVLVAGTAAATAALLAITDDAADLLALQFLLLALGLLAVATRSVLVGLADAADVDSAARHEAELVALTERARREELLRVQRTLHDTVINTLAGLRLPGRRDPAAVRSHCAADLDAIDRLAAPVAGDPATLDAVAPPRAADPAIDAGPLGSPRDAAALAGSWGLRAAVATVVASFGLLVAAGSVTPPAAGWAAVATTAVLAVLALLAARTSRGLHGGVGAVLAVASAGIVMVAGMGATSCGDLAEPTWPAIGAVVLLWLLGLGGLPLRWVAVAAVALVAAEIAVSWHAGPGADCVAARAPGFGFPLVAVAAVAVVIVARDRLWRRAVAEHQDATELASWTAILAAMDDVRASRVRSSVSGVRPLLAGLARGELDPADPEVMRRCGVEESRLRSLLSLGPAHGLSGQVVARVALEAGRLGHLAEVNELPGVPQPTEAQAAQAVDLLSDALAAFREPTTVALTVFADPGGGGTVAMVVAGTAGGTTTSASRIGSLDLTRSVYDDQVMLEVTWPG